MKPSSYFDTLLKNKNEEKEEIEVKCVCCNETYKFKVNRERYTRWCRGEGLIQDMLPEVPAEQRELLLSGICGECWSRLFPEPVSM